MEQNNTAKKLRRSRRGGFAISAGVLGVMALLVLSAPLGAATATHPSILIAPYTGLPQAGALMATSGCGGTLSVLSWPTFVLSTGIGTTSMSVAAKPCADLSGSDSAAILSFFGYNGSAFVQAATGSHTVTAKFSDSWNATVKAKPGPTPQTASASVAVLGFVDLFDLTNGTEPASGLVFMLSLFVTSSAAHSVKVGAIFKATTSSAKLVKGHHYYLQVVVDVDLSSAVTSIGSSSAMATLNLGTAGNHVKLVSVTIA